MGHFIGYMETNSDIMWVVRVHFKYTLKSILTSQYKPRGQCTRVYLHCSFSLYSSLEELALMQAVIEVLRSARCLTNPLSA